LKKSSGKKQWDSIKEGEPRKERKEKLPQKRREKKINQMAKIGADTREWGHSFRENQSSLSQNTAEKRGRERKRKRAKHFPPKGELRVKNGGLVLKRVAGALRMVKIKSV